MTDTLADLLARVEAATGPDREIDAAIAIAVTRPDALVGELALPYSSSLDASLALAERVLPGCAGYLLHKACLLASRDGVAWHEAKTQKIILVLLAAILRAKMEAAHDRGRDCGAGGGGAGAGSCQRRRNRHHA